MARIDSVLVRRQFPHTLLLFLYVGIVFVVASNGKKETRPMDPTYKRAMSASSISDILETVSKWKEVHHQQHHRYCRPFVTLTFAQTVDGKIALYDKEKSKTETSSNFVISGPDSLLMTHGLRSIHDAILIGGRTFSIDNPRLTNRLWNTNPPSSQQHNPQPRPVVLDTHLNHLRCIETGIKARDIIICCSYDAASSPENDTKRLPSTVTLLPCPMVDDGRLDLAYILTKLRRKFGIHSVMVEGGAQVLSMFMNQGFVDCVCITIAPTLFGDFGLSGYSCSWFDEESLEPVHARLAEHKFLPLGHDCILIGKWTLV